MALGIPRNQERSLEDGLFEALNMLSNMFLETGSRYFWQTLVEEHLSAKFNVVPNAVGTFTGLLSL